jgi:hypothetical protein
MFLKAALTVLAIAFAACTNLSADVATWSEDQVVACFAMVSGQHSSWT